MTVEIDPTESSVLLNLPEADLKKGWTKDAIRTAGLITLFLIFGNIGEVFKTISSVRLIELGICREHYLLTDPSQIGSDGRVPEQLCKSPDIQQKLAHLRGTIGALEASVGLLLAIPYGLLINRVGERLLAVINLTGFMMSCGWLLSVCFFWETFPISAAVFGPLFRAIGGSTPVMASLIFSILAKHIPEAKRSICFFFLSAVQLLTEILSVMSAASLLDHQYIFTPIVLTLPMGLILCFVVFLIPTSKTSEPTQDNEAGGDKIKLKMSESVRNSAHLMSQVFRNQNAVILLLTVPIAYLRNPLSELWLQYIPKKFGVSLATASRIVTIPMVESLILLLLVLPTIKEFAQVRFGVHSNKIDLRIVQLGFLFLTIGSIVMAFGQGLAPFILGLLVYTLGISTRPALQSVLTDLVSREHIAVLYTIVAVGDGVGAAVGALVLNRSFALAIGWEDKIWLGLPMLIAGGCYLCGFGGSLFAGHAALKDDGDEE